MIWILNIVIAVIGIAVLVGWLRNRRPKNYRDISRAEISDDLAAQDELLEDVLTEEQRARKSSSGR